MELIKFCQKFVVALMILARALRPQSQFPHTCASDKIDPGGSRKKAFLNKSGAQVAFTCLTGVVVLQQGRRSWVLVAT